MMTSKGQNWKTELVESAPNPAWGVCSLIGITKSVIRIFLLDKN